MAILSAVDWGKGRKEQFLDWIRYELNNTIGDRAPLERAWENRILAWRAKLGEEELDFPYPGASNYEMPLIAMHSDPVYADMMQSFHAPEDYWTPVAKRKDVMDSVTAFRRGLTSIDKRFLHMRRVNSKAFLDTIILGTCFYKNNWKSEKRGRRMYQPDGSSKRGIQLISEPSVEHVPIQRIYFPANAWSLDFDAQGGARWIAQKFQFSREEFARFRVGSAELPGWDREAADKVAMFFVDEDEVLRRQTQRDDAYIPFEDKHVDIYEVWARTPTKEEGVFDDVVAMVHLPSGNILRSIYFPNHHGKHPFHAGNYLPGYGILGIGMAEIDAWAQEATTDLLNAQIDNARLANTRMYSAPLGSSFQQNASVYPGKVWYLGPDEAIGSVQLADVYTSGFTLLQNLMQFSELRSGVSDLRQGDISSLPSRTPAASLMSILQEGTKRFDMVHSNMREVHDDVGMRMTQNVAQRVQDDPMRWQAFFANTIGQEDAAKIMPVLSRPDVDEIDEAFGISVTATSAQVNKQAEKQSFIEMLQITQQIYQALVQTALLMAQVQDPMVQETAKAAFASGVDILGQLFERFDVKNPEAHLGSLDDMVAQMQQGGAGVDPGAAGLIGPQGFGGGGSPPSPLDPRALASILGLG